jgi:lipid-A-disaccharide synthase
MGFAEVAMNIRTIMGNFSICKADIKAFEPDVLILVDYPGFNLRMAKFAHEQGIRVFYYISPQIWAWKQNRVKQVKAYVDEMYVILPFEKDFYARFGVDVHFVGHPLIDAVDGFQGSFDEPDAFRQKQGISDKPMVALLPGSRKQEITKMLPLMVRIAKAHPEYEFVVAGAPSQEPDFYESMIGGSGIKLIFGKTYEILHNSHAALVTSGTATLEAAIFKVPQVVCYKGGTLSYLIARTLVKVKFISLVNLIMDREVVKELIQKDMNAKSLSKAFLKIATPGPAREQLLADYEALYEKLGGAGASERTASLMLKTLRAS